uniref:Transporter n=1 Tax=Meloidogyne hapla TaxID=6305 RepID=A0A1I8BIJ2_MELHA
MVVNNAEMELEPIIAVKQQQRLGDNSSTVLPNGSTEKTTNTRKRSTQHSTPERDKWSSWADFIMSCVGYAIGLGNVWRFPYLCYQNGGGAFLIPYIITILLCGVPLFILETSWGQLVSVGGLGMFKICPIFKGVGIAAVILTADHLNEYKKQFFIGPKVNFTICTEADMNVHSPVKEFWDRRVLGISTGIEHVGSLRHDLALYLMICWMICYFCIFKGVKWTGKVVYLTASFPYLMLFCLLIRGLSLEGASLGLE